MDYVRCLIRCSILNDIIKRIMRTIRRLNIDRSCIAQCARENNGSKCKRQLRLHEDCCSQMRPSLTRTPVGILGSNMPQELL